MHRLSHFLQQIQSTPTNGNDISNKVKYKYTLDKYSENVLTKQQRDFYEENGYLVIRDSISKHECDRLNNRFDELIRNPSIRPNEMVIMRDISLPKTKLCTNPTEITKIQNIGHDAVYFQNHINNEKLLKYVECVIGQDIRGLDSIYIQKPRDNGSLSSRHPLHQDMWYFPVSNEDRIVAVWTALEYVGRKNGGLCVIPGSHKINKIYIHDYPDNNTFPVANYKYYGIPQEIYNKLARKRVHLEMNKGDTVIFHPLLVHGSGANLSNATRRAIVTHYLSSTMCKISGFRMKEQGEYNEIKKKIQEQKEKKEEKGNIYIPLTDSKSGGTIGLNKMERAREALKKFGIKRAPFIQLVTIQIKGDVGYYKMSDNEIKFFKKYYFKRDVDENNWK